MVIGQFTLLCICFYSHITTYTDYTNLYYRIKYNSITLTILFWFRSEVTVSCKDLVFNITGQVRWRRISSRCGPVWHMRWPKADVLAKSCLDTQRNIGDTPKHIYHQYSMWHLSSTLHHALFFSCHVKAGVENRTASSYPSAWMIRVDSGGWSRGCFMRILGQMDDGWSLLN